LIFSLRVLGDDDADRKTQAEVLLNAYSRELERKRLAAGAQGLLISGDGEFEIPFYLFWRGVDLLHR
jgi:hypothetical protein